MQLYRGVNTSLYSSLNQNSIELLERAVTLTEQGAYGDAQIIFDEEFSSQQRLNAVVLLERAELALKQLKLGILYRTLDEALAAASEVELDAPEYRLMAMLRAFAALSHKGNVRGTNLIKSRKYMYLRIMTVEIQINPAIEELNRARNWLLDVPVSEYTDIQVDATPICPNKTESSHIF